MKLNRSLFVGVSVLLLMKAVAGYAAGELAWLDNFEKAKAEAKERKLPILAFFSGSDWCGWCKKLDAEVLSQGEFKAYAKDNFVLFIADFPAHKKLAEDVVKQNAELQQKYKIEGFPTVLVLDAEGKVLVTSGYRKGGAGAYVEYLKSATK